MPFFAHTRIKPLRQAKGLTQAELAAELGVSRPTYVLIEQGERELTISQLHILARLLGVGVDEMGSNLPHLASPPDGYPKLRELIATCIGYAATDGTITKTKLSILTYLVDFTVFSMHARPMTGQVYRHTNRGPVADDFFRAIDDLYEAQAIAIEPRGTSLLIRMVEHPSAQLLSEEELGLIQLICTKWQPQNTETILDFVRQQILGKTYRVGEPIPYESILNKPRTSLF